MFRFVVLCMFVCMPGVLWAACPDGFTEYLGPAGGLVRDANGNCSELCGSGISSLNISNGASFDLFAQKNTPHALHIKSGETICYADLIDGSMSGTLNVKVGDTTYHANPDSGNLCPVTYTLSYSCGDGATGTPPESRDIGWGDLYTAPYDAGTCIKPGYFISGWTIDSTSLTKGLLYTYSYTSDKTMVAQWSPNSYGAAVVICRAYCANAQTSTQYVSGQYNSSFSAPTSVTCPNRTFTGVYNVYDALGNDTGDTVSAGASATWIWPSNVQFQPNFTDDVTPYKLSYSCGDGATGTPPATRDILYGQLYTAPNVAGTCVKPGYYLSGWKIDSSSKSKGSMNIYTYTTDKTMVAQWSPNSYGAAYLCDNGTTISTYLSGKYGSSYTPSTTACTAADGATFAGWRIADAYGNDTGDTVASGASFTWNYPYNIRLIAVWE